MIDAARFLQDQMKLAESQVEGWKRDSKDARDCHVLEFLLRTLLSHVSEIDKLDNQLRLCVLRGNAEPAEEEVVSDLYKQWLIGAESGRPALSDMEAKGYQVEGAEDFRAAYREVKGILTQDDEFFDGERLVELRDNAIDAHRRGETEDWEVPVP